MKRNTSLLELRESGPVVSDLGDMFPLENKVSQEGFFGTMP